MSKAPDIVKNKLDEAAEAVQKTAEKVEEALPEKPEFPKDGKFPEPPKDSEGRPMPPPPGCKCPKPPCDKPEE